MKEVINLPSYIKASLLIIAGYFLITTLIAAQDLLLPMVYAAIIAISVSPLVNYFLRKRISRLASILLVMLLALLIVAVPIAILISQASRLSEAWPQLTDRFGRLQIECVTYLGDCFNVSTRKIDAWLIQEKNELISNITSELGSTLSRVSGVLASTVLTPVYVVMMLYYQPHLLDFSHKFFGSIHNEKLSEILFETRTVIQSYLIGLLIEFVIIASLNSIGLLILGIDYAILLGIVGALLNIIPYIGGVIAVALFIIISLLTKAPIYALYVVLLYSFIQFIDNHYVIPKIIGSKVKLNALVSIIVVLIGAAIWGVPGMFLSIPVAAIFKVIFDRIEALEKWGFLLGDSEVVADESQFSNTIKHFFNRFLNRK
jgi:predicted PurR-regulated permease PerM